MEDTLFGKEAGENPAKRAGQARDAQGNLQSEADLSKAAAVPEFKDSAVAANALPAVSIDAFDFHQGGKASKDNGAASSNPYDFHQGPGEKRDLSERSSYKVKSGDTLWEIAEKELASQGRGRSNAEIWSEIHRIARLNNIANPDLIYVGSTLKLRDSQSSARRAGDSSLPKQNLRPSSPSLDFSPQASGEKSVAAKQESSMRDPDAAESGIERSSYEIHNKQEEPYSCSASSMQMALSAYGIRPAGQAARRELLHELESEGMISPEHGLLGGAHEVAHELRKRGLEARAVESGNTAFLDEHIKEGHSAIVNGGRLGRNGSVTGHFVFVYGQDENGNFIVNDPADTKPSLWSHNEMSAFLSRQGKGRRGVTALWKKS